MTQLNKNTDSYVSFGEITIKWFDYVDIDNLVVSDYNGNVMIRAERLIVDFELGRLLSTNELGLDLVTIGNAELSLTNYEDTLNLNVVEFLNDLKVLSSPRDTSNMKAPKGIFIDVIRVDSFLFSYNNQLKDSLPNNFFDYSHFQLEIPEIELSELILDNGTLLAEIRTFSANDYSSGFEIESWRTSFTLNANHLRLSNMILETPHSLINGDLGLSYQNVSDFSDFINAVELNAMLVETKVSKMDLDYFAIIPSQPFEAFINVGIKGPISRLSLTNMGVSFGKATTLNGDIDFLGLPSLSETFIDANFKASQIHPSDLGIFTDVADDQLRRLGDIEVKGLFSGFLNDFVAAASFDTRFGLVRSDLNLKFPEGIETASYSGELRLDNFDVGLFLDRQDIIGKVNLDGSINGKGMSLETAKLFIDAQLENSTFYGYQYSHIEALGEFSSRFFQGSLEVDDRNLKVRADGNVNLAASPEIINITSRIDTVNFENLGFTSQPVHLSSTLTADLVGLSLDSIEGSVRMDSVGIYWGDHEVFLDSVILESYVKNTYRAIDLMFPEVHFLLDGDFVFSEVLRDVRTSALDIMAYFDQSQELSDSLPLDQEEDDRNYSVDFLLELGDVSDYGRLFTEREFFLSPGETIVGTYYQRRDATLSLFTSIDSIYAYDWGFKNNDFEIDFSKSRDSQGIVASGFMKSERQSWQENLPTENLSLEAVWFNKEITINTNISQPKNGNSAYLNGRLLIGDDNLVFNFLPSRLIAFESQWFFDPSNRIVYDKETFLFERMELYQKEQSIELQGQFSPTDSTSLDLDFKNFDLLFLSPLLPVELAGVLNADIELIKNGQGSPFILETDLDIADFELSNMEVGNLNGQTTWKPENEGLKLDLKVTRESVNTIEISGFYNPEDVQNQLDIDADFEKANLELIEPLFAGLFSNLGGFADGHVDITGTLDSPILNGKSALAEGKIKFDYLGTSYLFDGNISFTNEAISFDQFILIDQVGNRAFLEGAIYHKGLQDFRSDIRIGSRSFQFLNTTAQDNSSYYGVANATGNISVTGPFNDLVINAKATSEAGTKFFIPLSESSEITQQDYITFVDMLDSTNYVDIDEIIAESISGVTLNFELDITPDAYVELIFDIRTGDIIKGRGQGNLNLTLGTSGEFELFGDLDITEGGYNFTIPAFKISKEFKVVPGSRISWYGDPYKGILDLDATYRQLASMSEFSQSGTNTEGVSTKYPVLVKLGLEGEMLSPNIDFEIELEDSQLSPTLEVAQIINEINNDEQELKRQVFSLLILRKFYTQSGFEVAGGGVEGSLSEFLTNQLSYFISQVDENLEVDVDMTSLSQDAFESLQLTLAYTFLNGRLKVSGGGAISQSQDDQTDFGDWSLRYLLTEEGDLRLKAFSQTESSVNELQQRESGVSFQLIKSFDQLSELFSKSKNQSLDREAKKKSSQDK